MMRITLLGPVELLSQGAAAPLGGRKQRAVFALLALDAGRVVPVDRLLRELWPDDPPSQSMMPLQSCVSRLRRVLSRIDVPPGAAPPRIVTRPPGWVLEVPAGSVDTEEFIRLVNEGRDLLSAHQPQAAARRLAEAVSLWTGPAMGDLDMDFASADRTRLDLQRLDATECLLEAQLAAGESTTVAESAAVFTQDNPFRERGWISLMLALYRSGRQADALAAGARLRAALADELGLDPSPEVASLVEQMLRHDPGLHFVASSGPAEASPPPTAAPAGTGPEPVRHDGEESQPMVGRRDVVAIMEEVLTQADHGRGRAVLIEGTAGIGKSTVLRAVQDRVGVRGGLCARSAGVGGEAGAPAFWPWVQIVRAVNQYLPELAEHPSAASLALIDPAVTSSTGPAEAGDTALGRTRLYRAVIDLLASARSRLPLTIVFDDAQWLDEETVRLLSVAVPELVECGVLFVFGFRSDETTTAESPLTLLGHLGRDAVVRLQLRTLDVAEVGEVVRGLADGEPQPAVLEAIAARTGGNPLFVTELVRLLASEHRLDVEGVHEFLPTEVRTVLRRRLARVPEEALTVLVVVALVGRSSEFELLVRVTGLTEDQVFDASEAAVLTGLLIDEVDGSGLFSLSHDLVRQTLAESVSPARRMRWHAKIAAAIQARPPLTPDLVIEVAEHLRRAAPLVGPSAAIPFLVMAADDALARLALRVANRILLDAMDLVNQIPDPIERGATARQVRGRLTVAQIYNKGPIEVEGSGLLELRADDARFPLDPADPTEWWAAMTVAVALAQYERMALEAHAALRDDLPLDVTAVVRLELGLALFELGHFDHAQDELEQAQTIIGDGTAVRSVILSLTGGAPDVLLGMLAHFRGDEAAADVALSRAQRGAGDALPRLVVATFGGAWLAACRKEPATCARYAEACTQVAKEMDYPAYVWMGEVLGGWAKVMAGDLSWLPGLDKAYRGYVSDGTLLHTPIFLTLCAEAHAFAGQPGEARALIEQARTISAQTGERSLGPRLTAVAELHAGPLTGTGPQERSGAGSSPLRPSAEVSTLS